VGSVQIKFLYTTYYYKNSLYTTKLISSKLHLHFILLGSLEFFGVEIFGELLKYNQYNAQ